MSLKEADAPTVVFIAYHHPPSVEIGARRVGALTSCLASQDLHVIVVSWFAAGQPPAYSAAAGRVTPIQIPESRKWTTRGLVAAKKRLRGIWTHRHAVSAVQSSEGGARPRETALPGRISRWRGELLRFIECVDRHKMWSWRAAWSAYFASKRFNARAVIASGPPMTNLLAGFWVARLRRIPFIADFRDPWYAGFERMPGPSAFERRLRSSLERMLLERSTAITVTTAALAERLSATYPRAAAKIHVVRNGFDGLPRHPPTATGHRLRFLYAGEIYLTRDPFPFLAALERLVASPSTDSSRISVTFVGECASYRGVLLADWLRGRKCEGLVRVLPPVTPAIVEAMAAESSVLLNLAQGSPLIVPAKTYEHLASGREVLVMCQAGGGTARLIEGIPGVISVDPSDDASLDRALADLYRRHVELGELTAPPAAMIQAFSRDLQTREFLQLARSTLR